MKQEFPSFKPFIMPSTGMFGWQGYLQGKKRRAIVLEANENDYPNSPPAIYIHPSDIGGGHYIPGNGFNQICKQKAWNPARNNFANTLLDAIKFIKDFNG